MATGPKKGFSIGKKVGSGPDNAGFDTYEVASGYATAIFTGDPVKLVSGKIEKAANGDAVVGVFIGCEYVDADGQVQHKAFKPASLTSVKPIKAKVTNDPLRTYQVVGNATVAQVVPGNIYAAVIGTGVTATGLSDTLIDVEPSTVGVTSMPASGSTAIVGSVANVVANDTFTVRAASGSAVTITILAGTTRDQLLAAINAVPNVRATVDGSLKLNVFTTDGTSLIIADGTGTPLVDSNILTPGTYAATVVAGSGMVRVQSVIDPIERVLEVTLVNQANL